MVLANAEDTVVVVTLSYDFTAILAEATSELLAGSAEAWSRYWDKDAPAAVGFLGNLADLARRASAGNERLYCHLCV